MNPLLSVIMSVYNNEDYLDIETILNIMYEDIIWTFPSTYLNEL